MCKYYLVLFIILAVGRFSYASCIKVGLLGEFDTTTNKTSVVYGKEIKSGVEIAKGLTKKCIQFKEIDINNNIANINDLIKKNVSHGVRIFIGLGTTEQVLGAVAGLSSTNSILFSPTATSDVIKERSRNIVLMSPTNSEIVKKISEEIRKRKIKKILTIFSLGDPYSKSINQMMISQTQKSFQFQSVGVYLGRGATLLELDKVDFNSFDAVFLPLFEHEVLQVLSYMKRRKKDIHLIGSDSWGTHSKIIKTLPSDQTKNVLFSASLFPTYLDSIQKADFYKEYKKRFEKEPTDLSAFSYDAVSIISEFHECLNKKYDLISCLNGRFYSSSGEILSIRGQDIKRQVYIKERL